ncbi:abortive infection family protein [Burkholderia anthina]|uniref:abortive infection family protein n=1 Tax=Burkholderia anthina TaxID=179879 RepID=UPI00158AA469|nr:abortive infection family protein [Burkholderia anthina]MBY4870744.1 abortive infection family protein [Burkholderia anthina]
MKDQINAHAARLRRLRTKDAALRESIKQFAEDLANAYDGLNVRGTSSPVAIDDSVDGDEGWIEARLSFGQNMLCVEHIRITSNYRTGTTLTPAEHCPIDWMPSLFAEDVRLSLLDNIGNDFGLEAYETHLDQAHTAIQAALSAEAASIDDEMSDSLDAAGDETLARLWQDAVDATYVDPTDALTRCSRFLEAVCAKILRERDVSLPKDKSMSPLVKACLEHLEWPEVKEAEEDVRRLLGGIQGICGAIGALRTHFGTAHGASSHLPPLDPGYAVFVKQATLAAAYFLLNRHQASPLAPAS